MFELKQTTENRGLVMELLPVFKKDHLDRQYYMGRQIKGLNILKDKKGSKDILTCMTVYNEPALAILISLYALIKNMINLSDHDNSLLANRTSVCIVVDGLENLSFSAMELFMKLGLYNSYYFEENAEFYIIEKELEISELGKILSGINKNAGENKLWINILNDALDSSNFLDDVFSNLNKHHHIKLDVILCIKKENKGKLDSHWWFFNIICDIIKPKYSIQMDTGTAPKQEAISQFYNYFEKKPKAGAAASMILIDEPKSPFNLLHLWQSGDFIYQRLFCWPAEVLVGYLTAIPGQFCFIRSEAFIGKPNYSSKKKETDNSPSENYFRGLKPLDPFQSIMFLAEDRILGFEIMSSKQNDWQLVNVPTAIAITDACNSFNELLQQRRRWYNSEFSCNLWMIVNIQNFIKNKLFFRDKLLTVLTIPTFLFNGLFIYLLPTFAFSFAIIFKETCIDKLGSKFIYYFLNSIFIAFVSLFIIQLLVFIKRKFHFAKKIIFYFNVLVQTVMFLSALIFIIKDNFIFGNTTILLIILVLEIIAGFLLSTIHSKKFLINYIKICIPFFLMRPIMLLQFRTYSFCNIHDTSWGTKGLQLEKVSKGNFKSFIKFKNLYPFIFMISWIVANIICIILFCSLKIGDKFIFFNIILYFIAFYTFLKVLGATRTFIQKK